jgi:hypothetical protein
LLSQDAVAWNRPFYRKGTPAHARNMAEVVVGRPLSDEETNALYRAMTERTGTDFFKPIGAENGARLRLIIDCH